MSRVQSDFSEDWPTEPPLVQLESQARTSAALIRYPMLFGAGIAATLAWQQLAWLAPHTAAAPTVPAEIVPPITSSDAQEINTISFDLAEVIQKVDQLAADQKQMTREITKLQAVEQYVFYKNPEPPPQPAPAPAATPTRNPVPKPAPMDR